MIPALRSPLARLLLLAAVGFLVLPGPVAAQHPAIYLMDVEGNVIDPINEENAEAPFSTMMTCGMCHEYDTITQGYHFQMGWDVIADDYGVEEGRPWSLSNGLLGRWYPYAFRQLAKKQNRSADEIDLTVYDFVGFSSPGRGQPPCGACHPGGGGLEFDREGNRYDEHLAENPGLADTLDGDYHQSRWDQSGVVEADCLICHLEGYRFEDRVDQLTSGNYKWAVVAGSRLGIVQGSVAAGQTPTVLYEKRLFNADGTITLAMSWPPPDKNCVYCHGQSDVRKRGFSWNDPYNHDIHQAQGMSCTSCHPAGLDHQIAKGFEPAFTVAPELNGSNRSCRECHEEGFLGAPIPDHETVRPSHLVRISCESCHVPRLGRAAAQGHEATTGELYFHTRPPEAEAPGEVATWEPDYERRENEIIHPMNHFLAVWWGNRDDDDLVYPLFLREQASAWERFADQVEDDDGDGHQEVNREDEIRAGLEAVAATLQGNQRFDRIRPVLIKAGESYELDESGALVQASLDGTPLEGASHVNFSINHNVSPTRMALGANGCVDCHVEEAHFFKGQRTIALHGPDGKPVTRANGLFLGCRPWVFTLNSFHQQIVSPYVGPLIMLVVFLIVLHYHSYGPKRADFDPYSDEIRRFSLVERGVHLFRLIAFVVLAVSGLIIAFNLHLWQELLFGSPQQLLDFHIGAGLVFIVTTAMGLWLWLEDAIFQAYDKDWVRKLGGYLGHKGHVPAGRFNAGQKMFYWFTAAFGIIMSVTGVMLVFKSQLQLSTICATSTLHNLVGFFLIPGVLAHAYLGTVANPGTWRVLVDGSVTREWARHHHPNWYQSLIEEGEIEPAPKREGEPGRRAPDEPPGKND
jgi:formate dehydrogenase gamma subunit